MKYELWVYEGSNHVRAMQPKGVEDSYNGAIHDMVYMNERARACYKVMRYYLKKVRDEKERCSAQ